MSTVFEVNAVDEESAVNSPPIVSVVLSSDPPIPGNCVLSCSYFPHPGSFFLEYLIPGRRDPGAFHGSTDVTHRIILDEQEAAKLSSFIFDRLLPYEECDELPF